MISVVRSLLIKMLWRYCIFCTSHLETNDPRYKNTTLILFKKEKIDFIISINATVCVILLTKVAFFIENNQIQAITHQKYCQILFNKEKLPDQYANKYCSKGIWSISSSLFIKFEFHQVSNCQVGTCIKFKFCSSTLSFGSSNTSFSGFLVLEFSWVWVLRVKTFRVFEFRVGRSGK